jgi:TolB-like protein/Tfp pilus assembly protein PilF
VQLLEQAVARDPTFLLAHCQLASANDTIYFANHDHTEARLALAETSVEAAVRLQPDAGETHLAQANHFFWGYLNYDRAREELAKAQRELPNNADVLGLLGHVNRWQGHWEEASQNLERAVELDPRNTAMITSLAWVYMALRKYEEADALASRLQALEPRSPILRAGRAWVGLEARADTASLRAVLNTIEGESSQSATEVADLSFRLALYERDPAAAARALANMPREGKIDMNGDPFPHAWYEGLLAKLRYDAAAAHSAFAAARAETEKLVRAQPENEKPLSVLALIDAELGDKEKAIREGRTASDMLPPAKNALDGVWLMTNLARIYALTGENDLALEQLEVLSKRASAWLGLSYGELRLNPDWDPLRGDPRFEKLVEEVKKPVALEAPRPLPGGIAVLPFENLSTDPENAFFADGVQDEILNDLAKIADLKVISRTSVMQYKSGGKRNLRQIASELGVAHVVEGSVQRAGNRVRVSAQLIDAKSDTHLWAESYDRPLDDVFAIQSDIAKAIAGQLQAKLSSSQSSALAVAPTHDTKAYDLFLKGEYQERQAEGAENVELFDRAEAFYRQALARDPNFALAYARLAYSRLNRHWFINRLTSAQLKEVKSDIERALAIAPESPDAYLALGIFHYWVHRDYDSALGALDRAIELQPSNSESRTARAAVYRRRGEWRRSLAEYERVLELNPRDSFSSTELGNTYLWLRRWSEAEHSLTRALALDPHNINAAFHLSVTYINGTGNIRRAREAEEAALEQPKGQVSPYGIVISQMINEKVYLDVLERRFADALKAWDVLPTNTAEGRLNKLKARVGIQVLTGQKTAARFEAEQARTLFEAQLAERAPEDRTSLTEAAWIYVCLGRNADALRIAREATESLPIEKDALFGANFLVGLAQIDAHIGRPEEAVKILRQLLTIPAGEYVSLTRLKVDPVWDPIRNNPEFQKLLSEPEPETVYQ